MFDRARIAVDQKAVRAIGVSEAGLKEGVYRFIRYELACGEDLADHFATLSLRFAFATQHIAG